MANSLAEELAEIDRTKLHPHMNAKINAQILLIVRDHLRSRTIDIEEFMTCSTSRMMDFTE